MGYRLTLPGGVVVDADTAHEAAELYIKLTPTVEGLAADPSPAPAPGVETAPPSKWKPNRPNGRGSIETSGKYGYRWSVMIAAKRHVGPTVGSEAEAEASLAEFLRTGVIPPKPPRAAYRCGNCFASGHTVKRCPLRRAAEPAAAELPPERQAASSGFGPSDEEAKQEEAPENEIPAREGQREIIGEIGAPGANAARGETIDESGDGSAKSSDFPCAPAVLALAAPAEAAARQRKPTACGICGATGHNARGHAAHEAAVASLAAPPAPPETFVPPPEVRLAAPTERTTRTRTRCKACGGLGHRRNNCPDAAREPKAPKKGATPPREIEPSAELGPIAVRRGDRFTVVEDFIEEERGIDWTAAEVWVALEPTGAAHEGYDEWTVRRDDGAEMLAHPQLHPFMKMTERPSAESLARVRAAG